MGDGTRSGGRLTFVGESDDKARDGAARARWRSQPSALVLRSIPSSTDVFGEVVEPAPSGLDRRTPSEDPSHHIVACVDVRAPGATVVEDIDADALRGLAMRRMKRCIRSADRVCMLGGSRFAVCFGSGAERATPHELGERIARAMGNQLVVGSTSLEWRVRVGVGTGTSAVEDGRLISAAIASTRSVRRASTPRSRHEWGQSAAVTVTHVPDPHQLIGISDLITHSAVVRTPATPATVMAQGDGTHRLPRRTFFYPSVSADPANRTNGLRTGRTTPADTYRALSTSRIAGLTILVVDPAVSSSDLPGSAVQGVAAAARRLGVCAILSQADRPDTVVDDLSLSEADAVVVVLHPDTASPSVGAGTPWEHPARLTRALTDAGASVIALSVGASAAAVAACVEHGAAGVLRIDDLSDELVTVARTFGPRSATGASRANGNGPNSTPRGRRQLPPPFNALIHLTSTERKVLFHMMEGRAAGDIAAVLVVSLTTVRSHIRSILRKLNVNSQLAAVAIANGADPRSEPRSHAGAAAG